MRAAPLLATLAALAAPTAASAATWSAPQDLSAPHLFVDAVRLITWPSGVGQASWRWGDGTGADGRSGVDAAAHGRRTEVFSPQVRIVRGHRNDRPADSVAGPVPYGRDRALLTADRPLSARPAERRVRLAVRFGSAGGSFGPRHTLRTATGIRAVDVAANGGGDAAVAWFEDRGVRIDRVYVSLRRAGGRFGTPRRLATGRIRNVAVAVGASGDVLVAWDARGVLRTRFKPRSRRGFRAADTIRSREAFFADMHPVVTANGRAVLAWSAQSISEGGGAGDVYFQAAVRAPGTPRFRPAQLLERLERDRVERPIDAVVDVAERVVVAWSGSDGATRRVRAAAEDAAGGFGPPLDVSPPPEDAILSDLAAGADGRVIAVWHQGIEAVGTVRAALAPAAGAPFGPPENASPVGQDARAGHAAFDPLTGRPTIVWSNRPRGSGGPVSEIETFAQAATRSE